MKNFFKFIVLVFISVTVIGCSALWILGNLDGLVKNAIEDYGTKITQSKVVAGSVKIDISNGQGTIKNFSIQNPNGFNTLYALKIKQFEFKVDPLTFKKDVTVIHHIKIDTPDITYEKCDGSTNFEVLEENIKDYMKSLEEKDDEKFDALSQVKHQPEELKKFIIEELEINNPKIAVSAAFMHGKTVGISLPNITLKNIGLEKGGIPASEISQEVVHVIKENLSQTVNFEELKKATINFKEKTIKFLKKDGGKVINKIKSAIDS